MTKILDIIGLVLIAIMTLSFVGTFVSYGIKSGTSSEVFWGCAGATLLIIIFRKMKRKQEEKENWKIVLWSDQLQINQQIYKGVFQENNEKDMTEQNKQWWKGLGIELETDIETFDE